MDPRAASFRVRGLKKNSWTKLGGLHAWESLFDFPKMTENVFTTMKLLIFFTSLVMLLSGVKIHHH